MAVLQWVLLQIKLMLRQYSQSFVKGFEDETVVTCNLYCYTKQEDPFHITSLRQDKMIEVAKLLFLNYLYWIDNITSLIVLFKIYDIQTFKHQEMQFYYFSLLILSMYRQKDIHYIWIQINQRSFNLYNYFLREAIYVNINIYGCTFLRGTI